MLVFPDTNGEGIDHVVSVSEASLPLELKKCRHQRTRIRTSPDYCLSLMGLHQEWHLTHHQATDHLEEYLDPEGLVAASLKVLKHTLATWQCNAYE